MDIPQSDQRRFDVLLATYQLERQADQVGMQAASIALVGAAIALLGVFVLVLFESGHSSPGWVVAFLPLAPLPLAAIALILNNSSAVRGEYLKALEQELGRLAARLSPETVAIPAGYQAAVRAWKGRWGHVAQLVIYLPLVAIYVVIVVESYKYASRAHAGTAASTGLALTLLGFLALLVNLIAEARSFKSREQTLVERFAKTLSRGP